MDEAVVTGLAGLLGAVVGGVAAIVSSVVTARRSAAAQQETLQATIAHERDLLEMELNRTRQAQVTDTLLAMQRDVYAAALTSLREIDRSAPERFTDADTERLGERAGLWLFGSREVNGAFVRYFKAESVEQREECFLKIVNLMREDLQSEIVRS